MEQGRREIFTRNPGRPNIIGFIESASQLTRNLRSIGLNLEPWVKKNLLRFHASRPTAHCLEMHLATIHKEVQAFQLQTVIMDPIRRNFASLTAHEPSSTLLLGKKGPLKSLFSEGGCHEPKTPRGSSGDSRSGSRRTGRRGRR